jgi:hypothetical protein
VIKAADGAGYRKKNNQKLPNKFIGVLAELAKDLNLRKSQLRNGKKEKKNQNQAS